LYTSLCFPGLFPFRVLEKNGRHVCLFVKLTTLSFRFNITAVAEFAAQIKHVSNLEAITELPFFKEGEQSRFLFFL